MKGNILLGQARGKLGDIVFSRANGQQVARARAQKVKNPQTEKQMIQRIILNTVAQAYSAMQPICDHSFEGIPSGQRSMSYFMRKNMDALRAMIAQEITNGYDFDSIYAFSPINSNLLVPNVYLIAKGTLPSIAATIGTPNVGKIALSANTYEAIIAEYGLQRGDQITLVTMQGTRAENLKFHYARIILDPTNEDGTAAGLDVALIQDGKINLPSPRNEGEFNTLTFADGAVSYNFSAQQVVGVAAIVSRQKTDGSWLRSNASFYADAMQVAGFYPSLQDCLNLFASGGIETLSDYYLNNAGKGALASAAAPAEQLGIVSQTFGGGSYEQGGSAFVAPGSRAYTAQLKGFGNFDEGMLAVSLFNEAGQAVEGQSLIPSASGAVSGNFNITAPGEYTIRAWGQDKDRENVSVTLMSITCDDGD